MPEGHTIHRLSRDLMRAFGRRPVLASSLQHRFAAGCRPAQRVDAHRHRRLRQTPVSVLPRGAPGGPAGAHPSGVVRHVPDRIRFRRRSPAATCACGCENQDDWADLRGPTACELITPEQRDTILARLGPDPLRADADPAPAWARISRSKMPIGALLMSQDVLSGIGNVYRAEVLFRAGSTRTGPAAKSITRAG